MSRQLLRLFTSPLSGVGRLSTAESNGRAIVESTALMHLLEADQGHHASPGAIERSANSDATQSANTSLSQHASKTLEPWSGWNASASTSAWGSVSSMRTHEKAMHASTLHRLGHLLVPLPGLHATGVQPSTSLHASNSITPISWRLPSSHHHTILTPTPSQCPTEDQVNTPVIGDQPGQAVPTEQPGGKGEGQVPVLAKNRGNTYQPSRRKRINKHGLMKRLSTPLQRNTLMARIKKGRWRLTPDQFVA